VLAVAIAFERAGQGCQRGVVASWREMSFEPNAWSREYGSFQQGIYANYPFGNNKPYDGFPVTAFVKPGRVGILVSFRKNNGPCTTDSYAFAQGSNYAEAWADIQQRAREWKWDSYTLTKRWPTPDVSDQPL
jgi:hypothetical protein